MPVILVEIFYKETFIVRKRTEECLEEEEESGVRKIPEREMGSDKMACFRTLWWKPVRSVLEGHHEEKKAERIHIPESGLKEGHHPPEENDNNLGPMR